MILSIVVATKGRKNELDLLLSSITGIDFNLIEIVIVDQNVSNFLDEIILKHADRFVIKHIKTEALGVSYARNLGVKQSSGQILCFPDDDCKFMSDTIPLALNKIKDYHVIFGKCIDENGQNSVINFADGEAVINLNNYTNRFVEATMFAKRELMLSFPYDERLGVGTFHGAEEAFDLILRLLKNKHSLYYSSNIIFYHPNKVMDYSSNSELKRVFSYRCGFAKLCLKHKLYMKYFNRLLLVFFAIPIYCFFNINKARYYTAELLGLFAGVVIK